MSSSDDWKARFEARTAQWAELAKENKRLRAALAMSELPCVYCSLPADRIGECASGFPGCGRMDDKCGCPEFGASVEADLLQKQVDDLTKRLEEVEWASFQRGPGSGYMDSGGDGMLVPACPLCHGIKPGSKGSGLFTTSAHGHRPTCQFYKPEGKSR